MNGAQSQAAGTPSVYPSHGQNGYAAQSPQATAVAALSQQPTTANNKKRKASGAPGSRGVANLTPEQLAKKRANDRDAQRAIRERTKATIENLERRIKELESQQPFQELQRVLAERDGALRECDELRRRLATVAQVVGNSNGNNGNAAMAGQQAQQAAAGAGLNELAALTAQQSPLPPIQHQQPYPSHAAPPGGYTDAHVHPDLRSPSYPTTQGSPASQVSHHTTSGGYPAPGPHYHPQTNGMPYEQQQPPAPQMQQQQPPNGERPHMGLNFLLDSRNSPQVRAQQPSLQDPATAMVPVYARLPRNSSPTCPLDSLLSDFIAARRRLLQSGAPKSEVLGPDYPTFTAFLSPVTEQDRQACHPVTTLLVDILSKFPDISALPEKVAVLYIMFLLVRWSICPCESCYETLPEWTRPVTEQLDETHAVWNDHLPWPFMRKRLATRDEPVNFEEFFVPFTTTLRLNWPYPVEQVLETTSESEGRGDGEVRISPAFETHLRDLRNWSLGGEFQRAFSELVNDEVRIQEVSPSRS